MSAATDLDRYTGRNAVSAVVGTVAAWVVIVVAVHLVSDPVRPRTADPARDAVAGVVLLLGATFLGGWMAGLVAGRQRLPLDGAVVAVLLTTVLAALHVLGGSGSAAYDVLGVLDVTAWPAAGAAAVGAVCVAAVLLPAVAALGGAIGSSVRSPAGPDDEPHADEVVFEYLAVEETATGRGPAAERTRADTRAGRRRAHPA